MTEHEVLVIGSGPVGLMLAAELALAGVDVGVLERRPDQTLVGSHAGGIHARALELLDQRGVVDRFLAEGRTAQAIMFASQVLDIADFPTRHPYALGLWQNHIERILGAWVAELPVRLHRATEFRALAQDTEGVDVTVSGASGVEHTLRARYLVGADGAHSRVRRAAGIDFPGFAPTLSSLIAEVRLTEQPPAGVKHDASGIHGLHLMEDGITYRVITTEAQLGPLDVEPTLADLRANLSAVYGSDFGAHHPTWISRFTDATRQAAHYRAGRVLLAGDAAHIHHPNGGQGMTLGFQDAVNLGWKLGQVVAGISPDSLLDSYESERHPVTARVLRHTMAMSVAMRPEPRVEALGEVMAELAGFDDVRRHIAGLLSGLDVRYDMGEPDEPAHPMVGRRMPDLDLTLADGSATRVFALLAPARPLLLNFGAPGALDGAGAAAARLRVLDAHSDGPWVLPVIGAVPAPGAVLIRPDGHVAWVGEDVTGLRGAVTRWFGCR